MVGTPEQAMDEALDAVRTALRGDARSWAAQVRATARLVDAARAAGGADSCFVELEIAGSWSVGQATATRLVGEAEQLTTCLARTLDALERGELLVHQGRVLLHVTRACSPQIARAVEAEVLGAGGADLCPADLRAFATRVLLRLESEAVERDVAEQRQAEAAAQRRTWARPDANGMGVAGAVWTAEQLLSWTAGMDALEAQERVSDRAAGADRTADQRRADLFAALPALVLAARSGQADCAAANRASAGPQLVLNVHVPMSTVLDLSREPGHLDGFGPLSAEHVRLLRPVAYRRVLVDAGTGRPIAVDDHPTPLPDDPVVLREQLRDELVPTVLTDRAEPQHDPSARLARLVDLRDRRCSGPGCSSTRTHRDHADHWPVGRTEARNLQRLSARCHRAKHTGWTVERHLDGSTTWLSPLGRSYIRPSPHAAPRAVDLRAEPPPLRPPPIPGRALHDTDLTEAARPTPEDDPLPRPSILPDDPPF